MKFVSLLIMLFALSTIAAWCQTPVPHPSYVTVANKHHKRHHARHTHHHHTRHASA